MEKSRGGKDKKDDEDKKEKDDEDKKEKDDEDKKENKYRKDGAARIRKTRRIGR